MKKEFNNVLSIGINARFNGRGCVNYDNKEQGWTLHNLGLYMSKVNDNALWAKKVFKPIDNPDDGNPKAEFKYKVSSECIRHELFKDKMPAFNSNVMQLPQVLYSAIADPCLITRGYMYAYPDKTLKKKSAITLSDAIETGDNWRRSVSVDLHTRSGDRDETSLYSIENVGECTYESMGFIDLAELQFISADITYDRQAVDVDGGTDENIYLNALKNNLPETNPEFGYYYLDNGMLQDEWAERGILLSKKDVSDMTLKLIENLSKIEIKRRGSFLKCADIELVIKTDNGEEERIMYNPDDNLIFNYKQVYMPADADKIRRNMELIEQLNKKNEDLKNKKKQDKKSKKETKDTDSVD